MQYAYKKHSGVSLIIPCLAIMLMVGATLFVSYSWTKNQTTTLKLENAKAKTETIKLQKLTHRLENKLEKNTSNIIELQFALDKLRLEKEQVLSKYQTLSANYDTLLEKYTAIVSNTPNKNRSDDSARLNEKNTKNKPTTTAQNTTEDPIKKLDGSTCPSVQEVNKNIKTGNWKADNLTWWVTFAQRPLSDNDKIKYLSQTTSVDNTINCHYQAGNPKQQLTNIPVIISTGSSKKVEFIKQGDNWSSCKSAECKYYCKNQKDTKCLFKVKNSG